MKNLDKVKMGKKSRREGKAFEKSVEKDLESKGWIVVKFNKQVELVHKDERVESGRLVTAKGQFNPFFHRIVGEGSGFPDFIAFMKIGNENGEELYLDGISGMQCVRATWFVQLVECKMNGILDKLEKEKIKWIKENLNIEVMLAKKGVKKGEIIYDRIDYSSNNNIERPIWNKYLEERIDEGKRDRDNRLVEE
jgi:hypothetical protein